VRVEQPGERAQVRGLDAASGPVAQHQGRPGVRRGGDVDPRDPDGRVDLGQDSSTCSSSGFPSAGSGSTRSGRLLRTLLTSVDTG
jgi:hypothetical protein